MSPPRMTVFYNGLTAGDRHAAIEGPGVQPENVRLPCFLGIIPPLIRQQAGQQQHHPGIAGRLAGNRVPGPPAGKFPDAAGIFPSNLFGGLKFDQASQRITGELSE